MILTATNKKIRSSEAEVALTTIAEFDKALEVQRPDFDRGAKAGRRYFPIDYGKWDPEALKVLQEEYRHPLQIDIASPRVDTLAGSLIADLPDPTWVPVQGQRSIATEAIAKKYYSDKDLYNYDDVFLKVFRDGLVHAGDLAISECYKYHVPGIKFERIMYGYLVWDPYWLTDDDRDAEVCFRVAYLNPLKLMNKYSFRGEELAKEIYEWKRDKSNYPSEIYKSQQEKKNAKVGDELMVIEKHHLEHIKTTRLIGRKEGDTQWIPFPIKKDREYLNVFAEINEIDWTTVIEDAYEDRVSYVTTVCRDLPHICIQESKKNKIQVNGVPFHHFTARRWEGKNMGMMESIADVEDTIMKRESLITELISKAGGGSTLVNRNLFDSPQKFNEWAKNANRPGHKEPVDLDRVKNIIQHLVPAQSNIAAQDQITRMYNTVLPLVSRVSEALASMSDSKDSGILFERKFQVNMIANTIMNRNMRQFINNVAESYQFQYQITYSGHEVEVPNENGGTYTILNKRNGNQILNDVSMTPRCRVVIAENTKSQTYQMRWRSIWAELLQSIDPNVGNGITLPFYMMAMKNFFETVEKNDEDKEQAKVFSEMGMMISRLKLIAEATATQAGIQGNTLQSAQLNMQIQQVMQQLQATQSQPPPLQHTQPQSTIPVRYPEGENINPQSRIEEMSGGMPTQPSMSGVLQ